MSPNNPSGPDNPTGIFDRFGTPKENEQEAGKEAICKYADLTSRVTFVGRCTSRQMARVRLYSGTFVLGYVCTRFRDRRCIPEPAQRKGGFGRAARKVARGPSRGLPISH